MPAPVEAGGPHHAPASAAAGHGGHGDAGVNPLSFRSDLAIWTAVVFLVLLAILGKYAWGPLAEGLDKREHRIADQIALAEQSNQQARQLLAEYEQRLAHSQDEVRAILDKARRDAELTGQQMLDKARAEAKAEQQRAVQQIEAATNAALKELADRSASLAVQLAGRILRTEVEPEKHAELIGQAVANFVGTKTKPNGAQQRR